MFCLPDEKLVAHAKRVPRDRQDSIDPTNGGVLPEKTQEYLTLPQTNMLGEAYT